MNKEVKPTWSYILNDLALYSLLIKCLYSEDVTYQDKIDLEHQIKLLQQKEDKLQQKVNQLETNRDKAIKIIDNYNCRKGWYENDTDKVIDNIKKTLLKRGKE